LNRETDTCFHFPKTGLDEASVPELAEVEHSRRVWDRGRGREILSVTVNNTNSPVWRETPAARLKAVLSGKSIIGSEAHGKQMLFHFGRDVWMAIHLGMTGELRIEPAGYKIRKHDHLVLRQAGQYLVFSDQRRFGRLRLSEGTEPPIWWSRLPPAILSRSFTAALVADFCRRRKGSPLKSLLLMQERFPGIGNWMADEILWRARLHPKLCAGQLSKTGVTKLYRSIRWVTASAVERLGKDWELPGNWLFRHRWDKGGKCPRCRTVLVREKVGGRTTCWCPVCQAGR